MNNNPYLLPLPDPYSDQKRAKEEADLHLIEFQRLCYEVFLCSADGKALVEKLKERYLIASQLDLNHPNAQYVAIWWDGFREAIRKLIGNGHIHHERILQGSQR